MIRSLEQRARVSRRSLLRALLGTALVVTAAGLGCTRRDAAGPGSADQGRLSIKGSDTMVHLVSAWAEAYHRAHPQAKIAVTGGGSGTGIKAMINGNADLCMASRAVKPKEIEQAKARGVTFREHKVCLDGIAVIVHPQNPVDTLTIEQLGKIFTGAYTRWSEVGGPDQPISVLSRESNSGTYVFFREHVLGNADYAASAKLMPATAAIVQTVRQDRWSIGYVGLGYLKGGGVKAIKVRANEGAPAELPTLESVRTGRYPIARPLRLYSNGEPKGLAKAFIAFCLSDEGQKIVLESGYVPLRDVETP